MKKFHLFLVAGLLIIISIVGYVIYSNKVVSSTKKVNMTSKQEIDSVEVKPLSKEERLADFEYLYDTLKDNYPYFEMNKRLNNIDWLGKKDEYMKKIDACKDDKSFLYTLHVILAELNNGHTEMIVTNQQYDNVKASEGNKGPWFEQLNDEKVVQRYSSMDSKGTSSTGNSTQGSSQSNMNSNNDYSNCITQTFPDKSIAYFKVKSFANKYYEQDRKLLDPFFDQIKDYKALIIDIRDNGGGSTPYWQNNIISKLIQEPLNYKFYYIFRGADFAEKFIQFKLHVGYDQMNPINSMDKNVLLNAPPEVTNDFKYCYEDNNTINPKESINFKGKIYLLVNDKVFSSSEMFAVVAKSTKFATIVGEKTRGDGIAIGPIICKLPNSGYLFRFAQVMGLSSEGICDEEYKTEPDIKVSAKVNPNISDDDAVKYILNLGV